MQIHSARKRPSQPMPDSPCFHFVIIVRQVEELSSRAADSFITAHVTMCSEWRLFTVKFNRTVYNWLTMGVSQHKVYVVFIHRKQTHAHYVRQCISAFHIKLTYRYTDYSSHSIGPNDRQPVYQVNWSVQTIAGEVRFVNCPSYSGNCMFLPEKWKFTMFCERSSCVTGTWRDAPECRLLYARCVEVEFNHVVT